METQTTQRAQERDVQSWSRKKAWIAAAVAGLMGTLLGGTAMVTVPLSEASHRLGGWHMRGYGRSHGPSHSRPSIEYVEEIAAYVLEEIEATESQQEKVERIVDDVVGELQDLVNRHHRNHRALHKQFEMPEIDREAMEAIRKDEIQLADVASKRILHALADVAEVLSAEQRQALMRHARAHAH